MDPFFFLLSAAFPFRPAGQSSLEVRSNKLGIMVLSKLGIWKTLGELQHGSKQAEKHEMSTALRVHLPQRV